MEQANTPFLRDQSSVLIPRESSIYFTNTPRLFLPFSYLVQFAVEILKILRQLLARGIVQYWPERYSAVLVAKCLLFCLVVPVVGQAWQSGPSQTAGERKPLILFAEENSPPFSYREEGVLKGRAVDLADALGRVIGRRIQVELTDRNTAEQRLLAGDGDGLFMNVTPERRNRFDFTDTTYTTDFGIFVRGGDLRIHGLSDLSGKQVGVTQRGFSREFLSSHPNINLVTIQNYEEGFHRLAEGSIDAIATSTWLASYSLQQHHWGNFAMMGTFASMPESIGVRKGNSALLADLNRGIRALKADGKLAGIEDKWRPQEMLFLSRERARHYVEWVAGGFLTALFAGMTLWVVTLKREMRVRRKTEEQIRMLAGALQGASDCIGVTDAADRFVYVNKAFLRAYEYEESEILGKDPSVLLSGANNAVGIAEKILPATALGGWRGELWNTSKTGRIFPVSLATSPIRDENGEIVGYVGVARNITDEKRAQDALQSSEEKFSSLFRQSPSPMVLICLTDRKIADVNDSFLDLYGFTKGEVVGRTAMELGMWANAEERSKIVNQLELVGRVRDEEVTLLTRAGERRRVLTHADVIRLGSEQWVLATTEDVTAERAARDALRQSELKYRDLFENANDVIFTTTIAGKITSINKKGELLCGVSGEQAKGMDAADLFEEGTAAEYRLNVARLQWREHVHTFEVTLRNRIASTHTLLELDLRLIFQDGVVTGMEAVGRDVSDRRQLEAQFRQVQKMEALGTLAGGVAHDFNNLLTVIKGYSVLAGDATDDPAKVSEALGEITQAANRGAGLTSQLLAFARQHVPRQSVFQVDDAIRGIEKMLVRVLGEDVKMNVKLGAAGATIRLDPTQFDQVLLNLAVNARDAMPNGGAFEFATDRVTVTADGNPGFSPATGEYAVIVATDTGCGIDKTNLGRIFEPFFTTKPAGKGTGLGLSTVYGIMKQNRGHVTVESEVGKGTSFKLFLPISKAVSEPVLSEAPSSRSTCNETVLLVDDDDALRHLATRVLEGIGYRVLCAQGVEEAERQLYEFGGDIHLLVTDVVMPGGSGELLVERLGKVRPNAGVLFMSGYTDGRIPDKYLTGNHPAFLAKPFTPAQLAEKVREILDTIRA